jgi:hypothetical protein
MRMMTKIVPTDMMYPPLKIDLRAGKNWQPAVSFDDNAVFDGVDPRY